MKNYYRRSMALVLLLALFSFLATAQQPETKPETKYEELPNFHRVSDHLYRGGQPKTGGLKKLSELGVKTIINLRGESDDTRAEGKEAASLGMQFFNIPMSSSGRPTEEQVRRVFEIIEEKEKMNSTVFVHCRRGSDRTGAIIAVFRIKHDGWTAERAIDEANRYGLGFIQFRKRDYINDYFKQRQIDSKKIAGQ
jgi:protein tyrosine/serine phosphatase